MYPSGRSVWHVFKISEFIGHPNWLIKAHFTRQSSNISGGQELDHHSYPFFYSGSLPTYWSKSVCYIVLLLDSNCIGTRGVQVRLWRRPKFRWSWNSRPNCVIIVWKCTSRCWTSPWLTYWWFSLVPVWSHTVDTWRFVTSFSLRPTGVFFYITRCVLLPSLPK